MSGLFSNLFTEKNINQSSEIPVDLVINQIAKDIPSFKEQMKNFVESVGIDYQFQQGILSTQAALETGFGKKCIDSNLFNIKAGNSWKGAKAYIKTFEYIKGEKKVVYSYFRVYDNMIQATKDYIQLIQNSQRYKNAWINRYDYKKYFYELWKGGYATDPEYPKKLIHIFETYFSKW